MIHSTTLKQDMEIWWKNLDNPMSIAESIEDIKIGDIPFRSWGDKHLYYQKQEILLHISRHFKAENLLRI